VYSAQTSSIKEQRKEGLANRTRAKRVDSRKEGGEGEEFEEEKDEEEEEDEEEEAAVGGMLDADIEKDTFGPPPPPSTALFRLDTEPSGTTFLARGKSCSRTMFIEAMRQTSG